MEFALVGRELGTGEGEGIIGPMLFVLPGLFEAPCEDRDRKRLLTDRVREAPSGLSGICVWSNSPMSGRGGIGDGEGEAPLGADQVLLDSERRLEKSVGRLALDSPAVVTLLVRGLDSL
jgi:hypothetical protein